MPGHPDGLPDSVTLLLTDAKRYVFEIDKVLKSTYVTVQTNAQFDKSKRFIRYFLFYLYKDFLLR